jgi:hypothetical protein
MKRLSFLFIFVIIFILFTSCQNYISVQKAKEIVADDLQKLAPEIKNLEISETKEIELSGVRAWEISVVSPKSSPGPLFNYYINGSSGEIMFQNYFVGNDSGEHNPNAATVLENNPGIDILMFNGIIYRRVENDEWMNDLNLTLYSQEEEGVISQKYEEEMEFKDGMATHLPIGSKIYLTNERKEVILIIETENQRLRYVTVFSE